MTKRIFFLVFLFICNIALAEVNNQDLRASILNIDSSGKLELSIENNLLDDIWIHETLLCTKFNLPMTDAFIVTRSDKSRVHYIGIEVRILNFFDKTNFVKLKALDNINFTCDLALLYSLKHDEEYEVVYKVYNHLPKKSGKGNPGYGKGYTIKSNKFGFKYQPK